MYNSELLNSISKYIKTNNLTLANQNIYYKLKSEKTTNIVESSLSNVIPISFLTNKDFLSKERLYKEKIAIKTDFEKNIDIKKDEVLVLLLILLYFNETRLLTKNYIKHLITHRYLYINILTFYNIISLIIEDKITLMFNRRLLALNSISDSDIAMIDGIDFETMMDFDSSLKNIKLNPKDLLNLNKYREKHRDAYDTDIRISDYGRSYFNDRFKDINLNPEELNYLNNHFFKYHTRMISNELIEEDIIPIFQCLSFIYAYELEITDLLINYKFESISLNHDNKETMGIYERDYDLMLYNSNFEYVNEIETINSVSDFIYLFISSSGVIEKYIINLFENNKYSEDENDFIFEELDDFIFGNGETHYIKHYALKSPMVNKKGMGFSAPFIKELKIIITEIVFTKLYEIITTNFSIKVCENIYNNLKATSVCDMETGLDLIYYYSDLTEILNTKHLINNE